MQESTMDSDRKINVAYFGTIEIKRYIMKSRVILRNYLLQKTFQFEVDGTIENVVHTHNYIFALTPSHCCIYVFRIDSFFVFFLNLNAVPENPKFERAENVIVETEPMCGRVDCNNVLIPELGHCKMLRPEVKIKFDSNGVEDFLICATARSCFLARNRANSEPSLYRIFSEDKVDDFQILQLESVEPIEQLSAGYDHVLILTLNGRVYSMGTGSRGELGHSTLKNEQHPKKVEYLVPMRVIKVACGNWHSAALTDYGGIYLWGWNNHGQLGDCCEIGGVLNIPTTLDILESVVDVGAVGNGTWLRRADQRLLTLGTTTT